MSRHVDARKRWRALLRHALVPLAGLSFVVAAPAAHAERSTLSGGSEQSCAVTTASGVACWGNYSDSRASGAANYSKRVPTAVPEAAPALSVAAGLQAYQCTVRNDGTIGCWGSGWWLDQDYFPPSTVPPVKLVTDSTGTVIDDFVDVAVNDLEGCGVRTEGLAVCWRIDGVAQPIPNTGTAISITNSGSAFCAVLTSRGVTCWDRGLSRARGPWGPTWPWTNATGAQGFAVQGIRSAVTASGTCALLSDATVTCWSFSHYPKSGEEYLTFADPVPVPGLSKVVRLSSDSNHSCAIVQGGDVYCWGGNGSGQLGNSLASSSGSATPVKVDRLDGKATDVMVTMASSCVRLTDASLRCWGDPSLRGQANPLPAPGYVPVTPDGNLTVATSSEPAPEPDATRPSAPTASTEGSFGDVTTTAIVVRWNPPLTIPATGLKQYIVTLGDQTKLVPATETAVQFTGLTPNTDYAIEVVALDNDGDRSDALKLVTRTLAQLTIGPPAFDAPDISSSAITIRWHPTGSLAPVSHLLEVAGRQIQLPGSARSYAITGLSPTTDYAIRLTARDGEGQQQAAAEVTYRTLPLPGGSTPTPTPSPTPVIKTPTPTPVIKTRRRRRSQARRTASRATPRSSSCRGRRSRSPARSSCVPGRPSVACSPTSGSTTPRDEAPRSGSCPLPRRSGSSPRVRPPAPSSAWRKASRWR